MQPARDEIIRLSKGFCHWPHPGLDAEDLMTDSPYVKTNSGQIAAMTNSCFHRIDDRVDVSRSVSVAIDPQLPFDPTQALWPVANWNGQSHGVLAGKSSAIADVQVPRLARQLQVAVQSFAPSSQQMTRTLNVWMPLPRGGSSISVKRPLARTPSSGA
jgi:hypothetical protein